MSHDLQLHFSFTHGYQCDYSAHSSSLVACRYLGAVHSFRRPLHRLFPSARKTAETTRKRVSIEVLLPGWSLARRLGGGPEPRKPVPLCHESVHPSRCSRTSRPRKNGGVMKRPRGSRPR